VSVGRKLKKMKKENSVHFNPQGKKLVSRIESQKKAG
jgi:hypothetical protein